MPDSRRGLIILVLSLVVVLVLLFVAFVRVDSMLPIPVVGEFFKPPPEGTLRDAGIDLEYSAEMGWPIRLVDVFENGKWARKRCGIAGLERIGGEYVFPPCSDSGETRNAKPCRLLMRLTFWMQMKRE